MLHVLLQCVSRQCFSLWSLACFPFTPLMCLCPVSPCSKCTPPRTCLCACALIYTHAHTHTLTFLFPRIPSPSHRRSFPPSRPKVSSRYSKLTCLSLTAATFALYHHFLLPSAELGLFLDFTSTAHVQTHTLISSGKKKNTGRRRKLP